jgi:outer membrane protein assembly factor BamD (BamD/ComL family)
MFFPRLRRQAKWMFVLLVLVFGVGFVVFGVGSGGGLGLGDVLNNLRHGSSGTSASDLQKQIQKNPKDARAYRQLGDTLQRSGDLKGAISAYQSYTRLRPNDTAALGTLAGLYGQQATRLQTRAVVAQRAVQAADPASALLLPTLRVKGKTILQPDPLGQQASQQAQQNFNEAYANMQGAWSDAVAAYKRLAQANPQYSLQLGQTAISAAQAGVTSALSTAIAAYKRYLKLYPTSANAPIVRRQLKQLQRAVKQTSAG